MEQSKEIDKSTESVKELPLIKTIIYYIWELFKDTLDTFQNRRYIRTKWWRKQIIKTKNWKYKIEWQEESYDGIKQLPYQEHIKVRNWNEWKLLWPDLNTLIDFPSNSSKVIRIDDIDATPYEWIYIITNQWKKTIIGRNWDSLLENNNYYSNIEARNLWGELWTVFIAWNINENWNKMDNKTWEIKDHTETTISNENWKKMNNKTWEIKESTGTTILNEDWKEMAKKTWEIKDFRETTIFNNEWKKILGPINIIHINNKPVIDSIEGWLLVKTNSWRIITKNNEETKKFEDIKLRYINWEPKITQYKENWERLPYNTLK